MPHAFVIMQIGDPELEELCKEAIFPSIRACGLEPRRVDRHNEGGLLKSEIIRFIQESDILIADLTNERPNVYLEVGYAMGVDKFRNLILTVREDHFPDSPNHARGGPKIHFDLAGYDILKWSPQEQGEFRGELETRIRRRQAILAPGQPLAPDSVWDQAWLDAHRAAALQGLQGIGRQGHMEVRAAIHPPKPLKKQADLNRAASAAQSSTSGWPIAVYLDTDEFRPRPRVDGIVASILPDTRDSFDYWSIRTNGDFYFLGSLSEDKWQPGHVGQLFFFDTRTIRATEAILYCIRLYSQLGVDRSARLSVAMRYGGLRGRRWESATSRLPPIQRRIADEDVIDLETTGSLDEFEGQLVDKVIELTEPLFALFDFAEINRSLYEQIVNDSVAGSR